MLRIRPFSAPALLTLLALLAAELSIAQVFRGAVPWLGDEVYFMHAAGAFALWLTLPIPMALAAFAAARGLRSIRVWLTYALVCTLWVVLAHVIGRTSYVGFARVFDLPLHPTPLLVALRRDINKDLIAFAGLFAGFFGLALWRESQSASLRQAELEAKLQQSRLTVLNAQLNPHFIYNAMNTISALMYEDLARTERLIQDLGDLLRNVLENAGSTWLLRDECAHSQRFVRLLEARFGDRLEVDWAVPPDVATAVVPRFALQTLIENAVKHNQSSLDPLSLEIHGARTGDQLALWVRDDGRGFDRKSDVTGTGLTRLREMLELLHGHHAFLLESNLAGGGAEVRVVLPFEERG
jgi:two-component system, LytTR family, sensor kinase